MNEELKKKLYDTGFNNECTYGGCSQGVLGSVKDNLGHVTDETFTAATALAAGVAASGNTCGACTGAILALGSFLGRDYANFGTPEGIETKTEQLQSAENSLQSLTKNTAPANVQKYSRRFTASHTECIYRKKKPNLLPVADTALTAAQK